MAFGAIGMAIVVAVVIGSLAAEDNAKQRKEKR